MMRFGMPMLVVGYSAIAGSAVAVPPTIHAKLGEFPAILDIDYTVLTTPPASPDFPDVELIFAAPNWQVWSTDTDNFDDIGDIGVISCPHPGNFGVRIERAVFPTGPGARDVKGISLVPGSSSYFSNITGTNITGQLLDDLIVQADTFGNGGEVDMLFGSGWTADMTIHRVIALSIGDFYPGTAVIDEAVAQMDLGSASGSVTIGTTSTIVRIINTITGSVTISEMTGISGVFYPGGVAETGVVTFGNILAPNPLDIGTDGGSGTPNAGTIRLLNDIPTGTTLNMEIPLEGTVEVGQHVWGSITLVGDLMPDGKILVDGYIVGNVDITGDADGEIIANADGIGVGEISGFVTVSGTFNGNICADNLDPCDPLPSNLVFGMIGANATVCGQPLTPDPPDPATTPTDEPGFAKHRVISLVPQNAGDQTAIRVTHTATGYQWWVGPPEDVSEAGSSKDPVPEFPNFKAAQLQCDYYSTDWGAIGEAIHV